MKINKYVKIAAGSILGIVLLLFIVLVVHIATVKPTVYDNATLQISRIDFKQPIDSAMAKQINRDMKSIKGVKNPSVFADKKVVVYYHDMTIANSEQVYTQLMAKGNYNASRYVVPAALASNGVCPVMDEDSFSFKFSRGIQRIFN
ncbi:hypothetical protein [Flavobacterium tegetincola]|uniref:hypothetical protein n=1 Tax=Flavobacterium tegetincola TaxID=150172 RepID=UPI0003F861DC|nr:hypothetical protein [Flavobacterium tegetincola]